MVIGHVLLSGLGVGAQGALEGTHVVHIAQVGNQIAFGPAINDAAVVCTISAAIHDRVLRNRRLVMLRCVMMIG